MFVELIHDKIRVAIASQVNKFGRTKESAEKRWSEYKDMRSIGTAPFGENGQLRLFLPKKTFTDKVDSTFIEGGAQSCRLAYVRGANVIQHRIPDLRPLNYCRMQLVNGNVVIREINGGQDLCGVQGMYFPWWALRFRGC